MQFGVLGTLEVLGEHGQSIDVGGPRQRMLLALLLVAGGRSVPASSIIEDLWGDDAPPSAAAALQTSVSRLRRAIEPATAPSGRLLAFEGNGYRLAVEPSSVDFRQFEWLADQGRRSLDDGAHAAAAETLRVALDLWRGPALHEFSDLDWARGVATRLEERRLAAIEDRARADLTLGRHSAVAGELAELVEQHPLRESLCGTHATALYGAGRQAEALAVIDRLRTLLVEQLGVDLSPQIRDLELRILNHDMAVPVTDAPARASGNGWVSARHISGLEAGPLVGRERERRVLSQALRAALDGHGQWVLLEGEAGIGKSRLAEQLADEAVATGADVLWGRSIDAFGTPAFLPWLGPLRDLVAELPAPAGEPGLDALLHRLLAADPSGPPDAAADPRHYRLFEAVTVLLERACAVRPRVIVLDDLHWADVASLELVAFLSRRAQGSRLLVIATLRPVEIGRNDALVHALAMVARRPHVVRLVMQGIARDQADELVAHAAGAPASRDVVTAIHVRCEGNPFFMSELARLLATSGGLGDVAAVRRADVPLGVRDVVRRRLVLLPASTMELVQAAAVIGRRVPLRVLAQTSGRSMDRCIDDLEPALLSHLLIENPNVRGEVSFSHSLVQEVVASDMSSLRRARLHLRAADAIEALNGSASDAAEVVAEHLWHAASVVHGARVPLALERAAEVAMRRMAFDTAADLLQRALDLRQAMPAAENDPADELALIARLTEVRRTLTGFPRAGELIPRAKHLARRTGNYATLVQLMWSEWSGASSNCNWPVARALAEEMAKAVEDSGEPKFAPVSIYAVALGHFHDGRPRAGAEALDKVVELRQAQQALGEPEAGWWRELDALALGFRCCCHALAGDTDEAWSLATTAASLADPYPRSVLWTFESYRAGIANDVKAALASGERALADADAADAELFRGAAGLALGEATIRAGDPAAGIELIAVAVDRLDAISTPVLLPYFHAQAALGSLELGDTEAAVSWIERAEQRLVEHTEMWQEPMVLHARACVDAATGVGSDVLIERLDAARRLAVSQGALGLARRLDAQRPA